MIAQGPPEQSEKGKGFSRYKILGASSVAAYKPFPTLSLCCASKVAVRAFTQTFAIEMARHSINVNCYAPGIVGTAMWDIVDEKLGEIENRPKGDSRLHRYCVSLPLVTQCDCSLSKRN